MSCAPHRWYLAQRYITRPLLIGGRKSGIRIWVLVPGLSPLRVYAHANGLVLFSSHRCVGVGVGWRVGSQGWGWGATRPWGVEPQERSNQLVHGIHSSL